MPAFQKIPRGFVRGVCNVLSSVLLQQRFETVDQCHSSFAVQFYLASKGKYILEVWGQTNPKEHRGSILAPFLICPFLLPLSLPYVDWLVRRAVCFSWGSHAGPQNFFCSMFMGLPLLCLLATAILDSFFLFQLPNKTMSSIEYVEI